MSSWTNPSPTHYGAVGFGAYPFSQSVALSPGESRSLRFFLHAGFGIRSFQEGVLTTTSSSPHLSVYLYYTSSGSILLEPTFPQFYSGWVHPVDVTLSASPSLPPGDYTLSLFSRPVSPENQQFFPLEGEYYYSFVEFTGSRLVSQITVRVD